MLVLIGFVLVVSFRSDTLVWHDWLLVTAGFGSSTAGSGVTASVCRCWSRCWCCRCFFYYWLCRWFLCCVVSFLCFCCCDSLQVGDSKYYADDVVKWVVNNSDLDLDYFKLVVD